jgi:uncharacterized protein
VEIDRLVRLVDIKKNSAAAGVHPTAVFAHKIVRNGVLGKALFRLGSWVDEHGVDGRGAWQAARDLLLAKPPRLKVPVGDSLRQPGEENVPAAKRLAMALDDSALAVQGPPGSGKTYTGARMICELVRSGKTVGITAVSHKVIRNLLEAVVEAAREEGLELSCVQKVREESEIKVPEITEVTTNGEVLDALASGEAQIGAGTAWLWAREEYFEAVDVLVVDEAGQTSLANALVSAQAAKNVVFLGDPQQLEQPQQGTHPEGTEVSALEHLLEGRKTLPDDRGLFLAETWRLHPNLASFTSEVFYENRLQSRPGLEQQELIGAGEFSGAGLFFVPVEHQGNQSACQEEVDAVERIVDGLVSGGSTWRNQDGEEKGLSLEDILIVAPYNLQVAELQERLGPSARVGTVDRFQGQEAHRLNVSTSRARCAVVLVANPALFEPECRTPRQMQLANAYCRYVEMARAVAPIGQDA